MKLRFLGKGGSTNNGCPTLYATDRDTYLVQGWETNGFRVIRGSELRKLKSEWPDTTLFKQANAVALWDRRICCRHPPARLSSSSRYLMIWTRGYLSGWNGNKSCTSETTYSTSSSVNKPYTPPSETIRQLDRLLAGSRYATGNHRGYPVHGTVRNGYD